MRLKTAPLDLILKANNKLTGDELRAKERADAEAARVQAIKDAGMGHLTKKQRKNLGLGWIWDKPTVPGWYATTYCWDAQEGMFPGADEWDGEKWRSGFPVIGYAGPFEDEKTAKTWADAHDVEA